MLFYWKVWTGSGRCHWCHPKRRDTGRDTTWTKERMDGSRFGACCLQQADRGTPGFCWGSGVPSGHIITLPQAHSNSLHPPAQNKLYSLNPFLPAQSTQPKVSHLCALGGSSFVSVTPMIMIYLWRFFRDILGETNILIPCRWNKNLFFLLLSLDAKF